MERLPDVEAASTTPNGSYATRVWTGRITSIFVHPKDVCPCVVRNSNPRATGPDYWNRHNFLVTEGDLVLIGDFRAPPLQKRIPGEVREIDAVAMVLYRSTHRAKVVIAWVSARMAERHRNWFPGKRKHLPQHRMAYPDATWGIFDEMLVLAESRYWEVLYRLDLRIDEKQAVLPAIVYPYIV